MNNNIDIMRQVKDFFPQTVNYRRFFHNNPELSFKELDTAAFIEKELDKFSIPHHRILETGIIAQIGSGSPCVALRADMDALPIHEETGLDFSSKHHGLMHACGHDFHLAMLLSAAVILKKNEEMLKGSVKLLFQPGEEMLPGGASQMIQSGALHNPTPDFVFGQHIDPSLEVGSVAIRGGAIMAATDELYITVKGKSCHAAQPHLGSDAVLASAQLVVFLQNIINKFRNPIEPAVLSITAINGGSAPNIFPEEMKLMGTLRSYNEEWRAFIKNEIQAKVPALLSLYNCSADINIVSGYPALINSDKATEHMMNSAQKILEPNKIHDFEPKMWAEDFAYFAQSTPSCFWFLGVKPKENTHFFPLHNSKLIASEDAMLTGTALFIQCVANFFSN